MKKTKKETVRGVMEGSRYKMTTKAVAQGARVSISTARRYLEDLAKKGEVVKTVRGRGGNTWIMAKFLEDYNANHLEPSKDLLAPLETGESNNKQGDILRFIYEFPHNKSGSYPTLEDVAEVVEGGQDMAYNLLADLSGCDLVWYELDTEGVARWMTYQRSWEEL